MKFLAALAAVVVAGSVQAATPASYAALDRATRRACLAATDFREVQVGAPARFSDTARMDARVLSTNLRGKQINLLCLYDRRTKRVEVQELALDLAEPDRGASLPPLIGTAWKIERVGGVKVPAKPAAFMVFGEDGRLQGSTGCNQMMGGHPLTDSSDDSGRIRLDEVATTRKACAPALMAQERRVLDALGQTRRYTQGMNGALTLTGGPEVRLRAQ